MSSNVSDEYKSTIIQICAKLILVGRLIHEYECV